VYTNYRNLIYFTTTKKLNRRQVKWSKTFTKYNFRIAYKKEIKNAKANALSKRLDFISKEDKTKTLLKKGEDRLKYSKEVAVVYKVIEDLVAKQRIRNAYDKDVKVKIAKA
jgi:hypothetical protein